MMLNIDKRLPLTYYLVITFTLTFAFLFTLWYMGVLTPERIFGNFLFVVFQLTAITIFAILGALVVGMILAHKILSSTEGFSPFEIAMMESHEDIKRLVDKIEDIEQRLKKIERMIDKKRK